MSLRGIHCPIVTPFVENRFAKDKLSANIKELATAGLAGFLVLGSSGESVLLTEDERIQVLQCARESIPEGMAFIAGCSGESPDQVVMAAHLAAGNGADYALVITPSYFRQQTRSDGLLAHFRFIADHAPLPVVI